MEWLLLIVTFSLLFMVYSGYRQGRALARYQQDVDIRIAAAMAYIQTLARFSVDYNERITDLEKEDA